VSFGGSVGGGVMLTIASWTYWATDPLLAVMLLLASSLAWHQATRGRDALDRANGAATAEPEDAPGSLEASDSWGRLQRAHVIAALAGFCALLTAVAVLLVVVASWSGSDFGIRRHLGAVVDGLGPAVGAVATVVIGWKTHLIWRGLVCYDEPGATELNGADDDPSFESLPGAPY
jgi:hypothetical protein